MCGIVGFLGSVGPAGQDAAVLRRMADQLRHRGPDDEGVWADEAIGIALSQRRLSIVDLSPAGHQPMFSACQRYVIVFNGEIYNYEEMRRKLDGEAVHAWRGHSDTEVFLEAISRWGITPALEHAVGMFAFALWDRRDRTLVLGRDRLGEKPLYYGRIGASFAFASELKAFRAHPAWKPQINREAVTLLMRHSDGPATD
jgi:asparagine synthase (glutamine-hydrolysing)